MATFRYPPAHDWEPGNEYWERVRKMGLPFPWEADKATPPGPIDVTHEWSLRHPSGPGALVDLAFTGTSEADARAMYARRPDYILVRRTRWTAVGDWEDVTTDG